MIRAVFFDIDGTLICRNEKRIPESCKKAIRALKANGIFTGIATGRHTLEIEDEHLLEDLHFDGYVTLNGQLCYEDHQLKHALVLDKKDVQQVLSTSKEHDIPVLLIEKDKMYLNSINEAVISAQASIHTAIPPIHSINESELPDIYQICIFPTKEQLSLFSGLENTQITQWHTEAYDLIPKSGNKTEGIVQLLADHDITLDEVLCFGDGDNDADMLKRCGLGIAMGDASKKAKEAADLLTNSAQEDGIYKALLNQKLI